MLSFPVLYLNAELDTDFITNPILNLKRRLISYKSKNGKLGVLPRNMKDRSIVSCEDMLEHAKPDLTQQASSWLL